MSIQTSKKIMKHIKIKLIGTPLSKAVLLEIPIHDRLLVSRPGRPGPWKYNRYENKFKITY